MEIKGIRELLRQWCTGVNWKRLPAAGLVMVSALLQPSSAWAADRFEMLLTAPWHGSYVCNQGLTRMQLNLRALPGGDGSRIEADFSFSADSENPKVPKGSFRMIGILNRSERTLALKQDHWLEQPADPGYHMVDMEGRFLVGDNQAIIQGKITTYGCQDFTVWQFFATPQGLN